MRATRWALAGVAALGATLVGLAWIAVFPAGHEDQAQWCREEYGRHWHLPFGQIVWL